MTNSVYQKATMQRDTARAILSNVLDAFNNRYDKDDMSLLSTLISASKAYKSAQAEVERLQARWPRLVEVA